MNSGSPIFGQRQCSLSPNTLRFVLGLGFCWFAGCHHQTHTRPAKVNESPPIDVPATKPGSAPAGPADAPALGEGAVSPVPSHPSTTGSSAMPEAVWTELALPEFEPAVVWYRAQAPLFVVTHGAGGEAAWHCRHFHRILGGRATLLCPRGKRRYARDPTQGFYYPDHFALRREVLAVVERFEAIVSAAGAARPYVFAGYSQGATMGALAFAQHGQLFSQLLLVEGGYSDWSSTLVTQFQRSGGRAVLFVCGTESCDNQARGAAHRFAQTPIRARVAWAKGAGHRPDGAVGQTMISTLSFLLDDDPRWQGFTPTENYSAPRGE